MNFGQPVPVRYEGGSLHDNVNELDYTLDDLQDMLEKAEPFDWTPSTIRNNAPEVIERYELERRGDRWVYRLSATINRPAEERNFTAVFIGGPRDGEKTVFLAEIRKRPGHETLLFPGYHLEHHGDDILSGWQMIHNTKESEHDHG